MSAKIICGSCGADTGHYDLRGALADAQAFNAKIPKEGVVALVIEDGEIKEVVPLPDDRYFVVCGPHRYIHYDTVHRNGTAQITLKLIGERSS